MQLIKHLLAAATLLVFTSSATAGSVFFNQTDFDNAASALGLTLAWSEDFESQASGPVSPPLLVGGGFTQQIDNTGPGSLSVGPFLNVLDPGSTQTLFHSGSSTVIISGTNLDDLGVVAFSLEYALEEEALIGVDLIGGGSDGGPIGPTFQAIENFIGWIGAPGEVISRISAVIDGQGAIDNIRTYNPGLTTIPGGDMPVPAPLGLILLGLLAIRHKRT